MILCAPQVKYYFKTQRSPSMKKFETNNAEKI